MEMGQNRFWFKARTECRCRQDNVRDWRKSQQALPWHFSDKLKEAAHEKLSAARIR